MLTDGRAGAVSSRACPGASRSVSNARPICRPNVRERGGLSKGPALLALPWGDAPCDSLPRQNGVDLRVEATYCSDMPIEEYKNEVMESDAMVALVVERLRAMADENRIRLLLRLKKGPAGVGELAKEIGLAQPSVSKHLGVLKQVGLLDCERRGTAAIYSIKDQTIFELCSIVCDGVTRFVQEQHDALGLGTAVKAKRSRK